VFFGTPEWAVPSLLGLIASDIDLVAVVTNPDRRAGRGLEERPSPVKRTAAVAGIEVLQPKTVREAAFRERIEGLRPEIACVVAYGKILPADLLGVPPLGFVNAHFSLLPAYRGAAPVQWSLINGDRFTGISIIVLTEGMDEGPLLAQEQMEIDPSDDAATLGLRLAKRAAPLLVDTVQSYAGGSARPLSQAQEGVSYAPKLSGDDVRIDWARTSREIHNLIRGATPEPGAWTMFRGRRLKITRSTLAGDSDLPPGVLRLEPGALLVGCGDGTLLLDRAQMQGKLPLSGAELGRGLHLRSGDRLE
jgi:methionyl-tRNA formyltransferase